MKQIRRVKKTYVVKKNDARTADRDGLFTLLYLAQLLSGREIFEGMPGEASGAREERLHIVRAHLGQQVAGYVTGQRDDEREAAAEGEARQIEEGERKNNHARLLFRDEKKKRERTKRIDDDATIIPIVIRIRSSFPPRETVVDFYVAICDRRPPRPSNMAAVTAEVAVRGRHSRLCSD